MMESAKVFGTPTVDVNTLDVNYDFEGSALNGTYAPLALSGSALAGVVALAERTAQAGEVPIKVTSIPTVIGPIKGSGITGTPTVAAGGSGYVVGDIITLAGGAASSAAQLKVATVSGGAVATVTVYRNGIYSATPSNAVAQASTTGAGTGATFNVAWSAGGMSTVLERVNLAPTDTKVLFTGVGASAQIGATGYYGSSLKNSVTSSYEWSTNSQRIDIKINGVNSHFALFVDGRLLTLSSYDTDNSSALHVVSIDWGSTGWRNYKLLAVTMAFGGVWVDGTSTTSIALRRTPPLGWSLGDSYTAATGSENQASTPIQSMGNLLGIDVMSDGVSGAAWQTAGADSPVNRVTNNLGNLSRVPDYVFYDLGYNDGPSWNESAASVAFDAAHDAALGIAPNAKYFAFGPATPTGDTANLTAIRTWLIAKCAERAIRFIDVQGWVNSWSAAAYTSGDNIHPSVLGAKYLGARRAVAVRPYL